MVGWEPDGRGWGGTHNWSVSESRFKAHKKIW